MTLIDKNYLSLQFQNRILKKDGAEFQGFFEDIMQKAFPNFQKIKPYGNQGDGGNDGFRKSEGIYYQVYAPETPQIKQLEAAKKIKEDFAKLKINWDQISEIKKYYFVFNDKNSGISSMLERALSELKTENSTIEFDTLIPKDLEEIFFKLKPEDILMLGFNIDSTKAVANAYEYLTNLEGYLDRGNGKYAAKALELIKPIMLSLHDDGLELSYEILECSTLQKLERMKEAKEKYENLCKRHPDDPRAFLYLAEFYLNNEDFRKNEEFLGKAEKIDSSHWLLTLEKLVREDHLGNQIDVSKIDERTFPKDPKIKSNFYRLYSLFLERAGEQTKAESFIEQAIHLNPGKINNYHAKLSILGRRIFSRNIDKEKFLKDAKHFLAKIEAVEQKVTEWGEISPRNQAVFNLRKIEVLLFQENISEFEKIAGENFELLMQCYFDQLIDKLLVELLRSIELPPKDLDRLSHYLQGAEKAISDELAKEIIFQFLVKKTLFVEGRKFFETIKKENILDFIDNLENKKYDEVWLFLKEDLRFAITIANAAKEFPDLRNKIIENLPNDGSIQKEKMLLLLNYDEKKINEAFDILKSLDLSNLNYFECKFILKIAREKKAWEFVIIVLEKLLRYEKNEDIILNLKLQLFTANLNLERLPEAIRIGEEILSNSKEIGLLDDQNKEGLFGQTIQARLKRGEYSEAKILVEKYPDISKTSGFKIGVETQVYLKNNDAFKALTSVVTGVKTIKNPTPEQYGSLFMIFTEIGNLIDFPLVPLEKVTANCFVKFVDHDRWYFVGDSEELDATKISSTEEKYSTFLGKEIGAKIIFEDKYRSGVSEYTIENILAIEKYILWQSQHQMHQLALEHRWDKIEMVEVPTTGDTIDTKYLIAFLEDGRKKRGDFFDLYCKENVPLAFLAVNEGGLANAIGRIVNENRGFVKFSSGDLAEMNQQKETAKGIIAGKPFYIDGTSALVFSETGLLEKVYEHLPNIKVPQSVITLLLETKEKFRYTPGQFGYMKYAQGKIMFSSIEQEKRAVIQNNFERYVKLLETKPQNIVAISNANKSDCSCEQKIPPELCDACILAQKENVPVLTEDFLYLKVNELETKKKAPEYCSAFALIRVLYEQKKFTFDQYLNFFSYLSYYRFRFLLLSTEDIEKAVFGDGIIKTIRPEILQQFNFPLTLSTEYGVSFDKAFLVVAHFLNKVLIDDAILPATVERIFAEIISTFPTDKDKKIIGKMFLRASVQTIINQKIVIGVQTQKKLALLLQFIEIYNEKIFLLS